MGNRSPRKKHRALRLWRPRPNRRSLLAPPAGRHTTQASGLSPASQRHTAAANDDPMLHWTAHSAIWTQLGVITALVISCVGYCQVDKQLEQNNAALHRTD